ncbi:MAG: tetratricopeptide repeat protein [Terriglobia bacterium]
MKGHFRALMILTGLCSLPTILVAQFNPGQGSYNAGIGDVNEGYMNQRAWVVAGKVTTLEGDPVAGVKVAVQPTVAAEFRVLTTDQQGQFQTVYSLNAELVKEFSVFVIANKKGFLKTHALVDFGNGEKTFGIPITLRNQNPDPELLSQADFVAALAPRLRKLGPGDGLSAKSEKDYTRGVEEFLDGSRPDAALAFLAKVISRDPSCAGCRVMLGLAELDSGDWDGANRNFSQGVDDVRKGAKLQAGQKINAAAVQSSGGRPEPALAVGVMESWRHQFDRSASFLEEALQFAPQDPLALQEIGRVELRLENWAAANTYLGKAEAAGASPEVRLLRAEALLGGGNFDGANEEMNRYLNGREVKSMPLTVRQLWARIAEKKKIEVVYVKPKTKGVQSIDYLHRPVPGLKDLVPATDQTPLDPVLTAVGKRVEEYFRNFPNTVSLEEIHQEKLSHKGKAGATLDQKFHYLCLTPTYDSGLGFTEYRANLSGEKGQPEGLSDGFMLTSGFASASLLFHPNYQAEATFKYLGRQKIDGHDTFVVAFAQRPEKARLYGLFKMGETSMPTFSQGLAWVDSASYEIIRLRTDLLKPLPEVRLDKETTEIDFGENHFKSLTEGFWLPREVKVSVDWNGKSLQNKHEYSDFKLFNVGATEKIGNPKQAGRAPAEETSPQAPN